MKLDLAIGALQAAIEASAVAGEEGQDE
jgi:hypothetical protein